MFAILAGSRIFQAVPTSVNISIAGDCTPSADLPGGGEMVGASLTLESGPDEELAVLHSSGPRLPESPGDESEILWNGKFVSQMSFGDRDMILTWVCLEREAVDADLCRRFTMESAYEFGEIPINGTTHLGVECPSGTKLVAGGCSSNLLAVFDSWITRSGFDPDNPNRWLCSWRNTDIDETVDVAASAFCIREERAPEGSACDCCPSIEDSLVLEQEIQPLQPGANRVLVGCDEGYMLLLGSCMLDGDMSKLADVHMFRHGFPPEATPSRSEWGCSWFNPTDATADAIATAVCLKEE